MKNIHLLVIDPQNDFCDIPPEACPNVGSRRVAPALPVPGAQADMQRLGQVITRLGAAIGSITVTMDSHPYVAIERTTFWKTKEGGPVEPFTVIDAEDVRSGRFVPARDRELVISQLRALQAGGRRKLVVWPVHCVTGTWGHNIHVAVADALNAWEALSGRTVRKVLKGEYPFSEHYGAFQAETPLEDVASTQFNLPLAERLTHDVDWLLVAGEASSHCVAESVTQLLDAIRRGAVATRPGFRVALLQDCMSPVPSFEAAERDFHARAEAAGVRRLASLEALSLFGAD